GAQAALALADAVLRIDAGCPGFGAGEIVPVLPLDGPGWSGAGRERGGHRAAG
ncbi:MAG: hypothetical protein AVDCRST_MAG66-1221, partial [uncultured Pseudonocardia sp.]